jgi:hypothetical protein
MEGRVLPVGERTQKASLTPTLAPNSLADEEVNRAMLNHALKVVHTHL